MLQCSNFKQRLSSSQATEKDLPAELPKKPEKHKYSSTWAGEERENKSTTAGLDVMYTASADLLRFSSVMPWVSSCGAALNQEMFLDQVSTVFDHKTQVSCINNIKQHVFKQPASEMCLADIFAWKWDWARNHDTRSCHLVQNPVHMEMYSSKT